MTNRLNFLLLLTVAVLLLPCTMQAVDFGDISIQELPEPFVLPQNQKDSDKYFFHRLKITNHGTHPATIQVTLFGVSRSASGSGSCERTVSLAPGTQTILPLAIPSITFWFPSFDIAINGKRDSKKIQELNANSHGKAMNHSNIPTILSPTLERRNIARLLREDTYLSPLPYADNVSTWPTDIRAYQGFDTICLSTQDALSPSLKETLEDYVRLGNHLVTILTPEEPWPLDTPEPPIGQEAKIPCGMGFKHFIRPLSSADEKALSAILQDPNSSPSSPIVENARHLYQSVAKQPPVQWALPFQNINPPPIPYRLLFFSLLLFVLLVGPCAYFWLSKRKKQLMILVVCPAISLCFCGIIIAFITFRNGWGTHLNATGVTLLDQTTNTAITSAQMSILSPFTPNQNLHFENNHLLTFSDNHRDINVLDYPGQVLSPSIFTPQIPLNFRLQHTEKRSERIQITQTSPKSIDVTNGLGAPISFLFVKTSPKNAAILQKTLQPGDKATVPVTTANTVSNSALDAEKLHQALKYMQTYPHLLPLWYRTPWTQSFLKSWQAIEALLPEGHYLALVPAPVFYTTGFKADEQNVFQAIIGKYN